MSATWEIQKALYDALNGNSSFMTLIGSKLYDEPPTDTDYPYVVISETTEISDNRLDKLGFEDTVTFLIYTKPAGLGFYTAKKILEAMNTVLNVHRFTLTNYNMLMCKIDNVRTIRDDDKRIISARYRVWAHSDTAHSV
jgi:hypothetical protein